MLWPRTFRECKEDIKAWYRGERRVAPGSRGRVYARVSKSQGGSQLLAQGTGDVELVPHRIWKDSEQKWYSVEEYRKKFGGGT